jgi:uncharacterized protein (TIGR02145 family)
MRNYVIVFCCILLAGCEADKPLINNDNTVTDIDGNTYPTVTIGSQIWMAKNLDVSRYRNGDPIPQVQDAAEWSNLTTGAWCYYENNTANGPIYGKLYNWYAVNDPRGLAPEGWHVPASAEIISLTDYLGGEDVAGGKLKSTGFDYWKAPNKGASNITKFNALGAGVLHTHFNFLREVAKFWCSDLINTQLSYTFIMNSDYEFLITDSDDIQDGYSIRCIKD